MRGPKQLAEKWEFYFDTWPQTSLASVVVYLCSLHKKNGQFTLFIILQKKNHWTLVLEEFSQDFFFQKIQKF